MRIATPLIATITFMTMVDAYAQAPPPPDPNNRSAEVTISDDALQFRYFTDADKVGVDEGVLSFGAFLGEARDVVLTAGMLVPFDFNLGPLDVRLGPQAYAALLQDENSDVFALALGAQVRLPLAPSRNMAIVGTAYYSPDVTTFGSADNVTDLEGRVELRVTRSIVGMVGYRWFELDLTDAPTRRPQDEFFVGGRWLFD